MIQDKFNMVDMGGIDVLESQGEIVQGLYSKLVESITLCRYSCLYNWKFNGIAIAPTYVELDIKADGVWINDYIVVTEDDTIHIYTLEPGQPVINPLNAVSNGTYNVSEGVDGFNPVTVQVPPPVIVPITITENGIVNVPEGVDGYNPVDVEVAGSFYESSLSVVDGNYINTRLSTPGTPFIVDGWFAANSSNRLVFQITPVKLVAEIEFDIIPMSDSINFSFGGSNSPGGVYTIGATKFSFYAGGNKFNVSYATPLQTGEEYHMKLIIHADRAELYLDDNIIATGNSNFCANSVNSMITSPIALLANQSAYSEWSPNKLNNINIKIHMEE